MQEPDNKTYWQKVSKLYAPFMKSNSGLYKDICLRIRPYLSKDMNVLELACGTGQLSYPLSRQVRLWEATDFSEAMIAQAKNITVPPACIFPCWTQRPCPMRREHLTQ